MSDDAKMTDASDDIQLYDGTQLKNLLDTVNPMGSFATTGKFTPASLSPILKMEGVGTVGLPLHHTTARFIKDSIAEKAPFGRGPATLVDETVRKAWQIDPSKVSVSGTDWVETVAEVVEKASYELGISRENVEALGIEAHLYKVLLHEKGGHFKPHKDTVKEDGRWSFSFPVCLLEAIATFRIKDKANCSSSPRTARLASSTPPSTVTVNTRYFP